MGSFDVPNREELKPTTIYNYDLKPNAYINEQGVMEEGYDQFLTLRDTLVYSGKIYKGKAGARLIIGEKENTVEVIRRNKFIQKMNPNRESNPTTDLNTIVEGPYTIQNSDISYYGLLSCVIQKDGYYRIEHKEEVLLDSGTSKVYAYVDLYENGAGTATPIAVFDRESKNGADYILGDLFKKITAYGVIERNLKAGDILVLRLKDQNNDNLTLQGNRSNRWSVEYKDLSLKE